MCFQVLNMSMKSQIIIWPQTEILYILRLIFILFMDNSRSISMECCGNLFIAEVRSFFYSLGTVYWIEAICLLLYIHFIIDLSFKVDQRTVT